MQASRIRIPGKTQVRNPVTKKVILCAWDDCENPGYDEIKIVVKEPTKNLHYIFCSERHKRYQLHGHREFGKLAP
jgi:hypothetical protein